ncbi:MAG: SDR family NAD(P)-dependent oxidoreductase [Deltaproteobacteria bacterium]|nr:MAG: SDR family NAD(P)-dependent oxidoreductase [Deltaproteobacteria bacterium]
MNEGAQPLRGVVALVTGASRGIGKGVALELAAHGARVYFTARSTSEDPSNPGTLSQTERDIAALGGEGIALRCDHHDDAQVEDALVNNACAAVDMARMIGKRFWELPVDVYDECHRVGTRSAYVATALGAPLLFESERGLVVNVSSHGAETYLMGVAYGVGKAALDRITRDTARELADRGVAVVSIWPGLVRTEHLMVQAEQREDGGYSVFGLPLDGAEWPRFSGRAAAALAGDPKRMQKSGSSHWVAELAREYGFRDIDGRLPGIGPAEQLPADIPPFWKLVRGIA